ncbi:MAG TPA: AAA family ATPase [Candidatus Polarisedimenticolia bacterium]|jgi:ATP-dependent Clp protease ATP-binding subunit ClpC|nr:AAA family ATPase [Candidatus Polarisedimenticolia bacterium]
MTLSPAVLDLLELARQGAKRRRQMFCAPEQLLETLLLRQGRTRSADVLSAALDSRPRLPFNPPGVELSKGLRTGALAEAAAYASREGRSAVVADDLLTALLSPASGISATLREEVGRRVGAEAAERVSPPDESAREIVPMPSTDETGPRTSNCLQPFRPRRDDRFLVDRRLLVEEVLLSLLYCNPLLVGPVGSGRRSLVRLVIRRIREGACPETLRKLEFAELDPTRLVAGTTYRGELEQRVECLVQGILATETPHVLVVEDLHLLAGGGSTGGGIDIASTLLPYLKSQEITILGCTTHDLLREKMEKQVSFLRCFGQVQVAPATAEEGRRLLATQSERLRESFGVEAGDDAIESALTLCREHLPHIPLPGAAEGLLRGAAARVAFEEGMRPEGSAGSVTRVVTPREVLLSLSQQHRIPIEHLDSGVGDKIRGLERAFGEQIFGQGHVLPVLEKTVKVALMNLSDPRRPRGRIFFLGPPGTGKTECARLLAHYLMGSESMLLRYDMSEYQSRSSISTLIGSDKGLVQSEEGGRLTEPLRENPHRVILFDEIEKAHPAIFNLFLQILDNGEIHDKRGCLVSFRHAFCVFTSNAGCEGGEALSGATREAILERLRPIFRPEFLDRIESFVPFQALDAKARAAIAAYQLERLRALALRTHDVDLTWDDPVVKAASRPADGEAGARHILRYLQSEATPAVVDALLSVPVDAPKAASIRLAVAEDGRLLARAESTTTPR